MRNKMLYYQEAINYEHLDNATLRVVFMAVKSLVKGGVYQLMSNYLQLKNNSNNEEVIACCETK